MQSKCQIAEADAITPALIRNFDLTLKRKVNSIFIDYALKHRGSLLKALKK